MSTLIVAGTGIGGSGQMTVETIEIIKISGAVPYVVADPIIDDYLIKLNKNSRSMSNFYKYGKPRLRTYHDMVNSIIDDLSRNELVCAVFYGHPGVFCYPSHEAVIKARELGHEAKMIPAISAEDCLFSDLNIDPSRNGCQSFEATDFLLKNRTVDIHSSVILWQIGVVGQLNPTADVNRHGLSVLASKLSDIYGSHHFVTVYQAARNALDRPLMHRTKIMDLPVAPVSTISTLFIPALREADTDMEIYRRLNIDDNYIDVARSLKSVYSNQGFSANI
ncbi:SAM-dependent methyltransferase [Acidomonas methanolica]|uniref:SAM-dependent methyltransferase n=1 Tax=Acidomonas methanolica TaxID=437 RepID=UPI002119E4C4|nr:SAM-dependent methyltransferase [Acidomonas methanolica]MCQ9156795.1 hypothetical protein [Acidomonas methanolica]